MLNALDYTLEEWQGILVELGEPKFRAKQIFDWLSKGREFSEMANLPNALIAKLMENYEANTVKIHSCLVSKKDGTRKYIFSLADGNIIEGVLMSYKYGNTICISTQVGCRMNCKFCASGLDGLVRNMSAGEMLGEVIAVNRDISEHGERCITNIVLMGSGEPLDNYDNVIKFLKLANHDNGLNIGKRNISLSTCGLCDKIYSLVEDMPGVTLTISLHAPNDILRDEIMPVNKAYNIRELMKAVRFYFKKTGRRIIFEYSMMDGLNDTIECAEELSMLLRGLPCHLNIINLNYVKERDMRATNKNRVQDFIEFLEDEGVSVTLRRTMGSDIEGACGQLRRSVLEAGNIVDAYKSDVSNYVVEKDYSESDQDDDDVMYQDEEFDEDELYVDGGFDDQDDNYDDQD